MYRLAVFQFFLAMGRGLIPPLKSGKRKIANVFYWICRYRIWKLGSPLVL